MGNTVRHRLLRYNDREPQIEYVLKRSGVPDQLIINEYQLGQEISPVGTLGGRNPEIVGALEKMSKITTR